MSAIPDMDWRGPSCRKRESRPALVLLGSDQAFGEALALAIPRLPEELRVLEGACGEIGEDGGADRVSAVERLRPTELEDPERLAADGERERACRPGTSPRFAGPSRSARGRPRLARRRAASERLQERRLRLEFVFGELVTPLGDDQVDGDHASPTNEITCLIADDHEVGEKP